MATNPSRRLSVREMEGVGRSLGEVNKNNLASRRFKKGECPTCGARTHKVGFFGKRIALTIDGQSLFGRCLLCHPVEGFARSPEVNAVDQSINSPYPQILDLAQRPSDIDDDDGTMVSGITMDHRLIAGAQNWRGGHEIDYDSASERDFSNMVVGPVPGRRRPEASVCGDNAPPRRPPGRDESLYISGTHPIQHKRYASSDEMRMGGIDADLSVVMESDNHSRTSQTRSRTGRNQSNSQMGAETMFDHSVGDVSALSRRDRSPGSRRGASPKPYNPKVINEESSASTSTKHSHESVRKREIRLNPFSTKADLAYTNEWGSVNTHDHSRIRNPLNEGYNADDTRKGLMKFKGGGSHEFAVGIPHGGKKDEYSTLGLGKKNDFVPRDGGFRGAPAPLFGSTPGTSGGLSEDDDDDADQSAFRDIRIQPGVMTPNFQRCMSSFQQSGSGMQSPPSFARSHSGVPLTQTSQKPSLSSEYMPSVRFHVNGMEQAPPERTFRESRGGPISNNMLPDDFGMQVKDRYDNHQPDFAIGVGVPSRDQYDPGEEEFYVLDKVPKERFSEGNRLKDPYLNEAVTNSPPPDQFSSSISHDQNDFRPEMSRNDNRNRVNVSDVDTLQGRHKRGIPDSDTYSSSSAHPGVPLNHQGGNKLALAVDISDNSKMPSRDVSRLSSPPRRSQEYQPTSTSEEPNGAIEATQTQDNYMRIAPTISNLTVQTIPVILNSLEQATERQRENAFRNLSQIVFANGQKAKIHSKQNYAIETLIDFMWSDMGVPGVLAACCEYLFALLASTDGEAHNDSLTGTNAQKAIDALLITMQSYISVESIQRSGIGSLCCLAQASANNLEVDDGTLCGAVLSVTNAMDAHPGSSGVQEWGIRALYSQCIQSVNAERNKSSLCQAANDGGIGLEVVARAMETLKNDMVSVEWACRLYWCLSTSDDIIVAVSSSPMHVSAIMSAVRTFSKRSSTSALIKASFGALANFARNDKLSAVIVDSGFVPILSDSMRHYSEDEGVNVEACALFSNLAQVPENKNELVQNYAIDVLSCVIHAFPKNSELQEEAVIALLCLAIGSDEAKKAISTKGTFSLLVEVLSDRTASVNLLEMVCSLLGSVCSLDGSAQLAETTGLLDSVLFVMKARPNERKVLEPAMLLLRNLVCHGQSHEVLLGTDAIQTVCNAMYSISDSESLHVNGCCTLWSICAKTAQGPISVVAAGGIELIVKSMQWHIASAQVLEMACGTLWSLVDRSDDRKRLVVDSSVIDSVTCALMMHPKETKTLETACGVLSNISVKSQLASAVSDSQEGIISIIVDAMRYNASSMCLLEFGTLVLRNIVLTNPRSAAEASNGISTIINGMKDHPDSVSFNVEACNALWALAAQSEECKARILDLDGVTILMEALDHNNSVSDVQEAARGAIDWLCRPPLR